MKLIIATILVCGSASATTLHCPAQYPLETHALVGDPNTFVSISRLSGGGVYLGEIGEQGELHGHRKYSKAGVDVRYGLPDGIGKWFVCQYGASAITMWTKIDTTAASCTLRQRNLGGVVGGITITAECK